MCEKEAECASVPWRKGQVGGCIVSESGRGECWKEPDNVKHYGGALVCESIHPANIRRIIACVHACEGLKTETLEYGGIGHLSRIIVKNEEGRQVKEAGDGQTD